MVNMHVWVSKYTKSNKLYFKCQRCKLCYAKKIWPQFSGFLQPCSQEPLRWRE